MNKKTNAIIGLLIIIFLVSGFSMHRIFRDKNKSASKDSNLVTVTQGNIAEKVIAVGNIAPLQSVDVKSPISGTISQLFHNAGDYVKKGDPLLEVKPEPTPDEYATAKQQVETDKVAEKNALANVSRYQFLLTEKAISPDDIDFANANASYKQTRLTTELDTEKLALLEKGKASIGGRDIANIIKSPIDGYVLDRGVDLGGPVIAQSSAQPGNTLFTIANMNNLIFQGQVSEIDAAKIHKNMPAVVKIAALPDTNINGTLSQIGLQSVQANNANTSNSNTNTSSGSNTSSPFNVGFSIQITHLNIPGNINLLAGYSATAEIIINTANKALLVPERVLQFDTNQTFVWINDDNDIPKKQMIKVGLSDGMNVQVLSGLNLGEQVLVSGPSTDNG